MILSNRASSASPSPSLSDQFTCFGQLPIELRHEIWRMCLPIRVNELDFPVCTGVYGWDSKPCSLCPSTILNTLPPTIAWVCAESRQFAYKQGIYADDEPDGSDPPYYVEWWAPNSASGTVWVDDAGTSVTHFSWNSAYEAESDDKSERYERPLLNLDYCATESNTQASLTEFYLSAPSCSRDWLKLVAVLNSRSRWIVVMDVVATHAPVVGVAATSGLFGLLGDAPVQIVEVSDVDKINAMYDLAERCEEGSVPKHAQAIVRRSAVEWRLMLDAIVAPNEKLNNAKLSSQLCPAIMFRWCTYMCNHPERRLPFGHYSYDYD